MNKEGLRGQLSQVQPLYFEVTGSSPGIAACPNLSLPFQKFNYDE